MWQLFSPPHSVVPHSYTNSSLIRAEKCDFHIPLVESLLLVPFPAPCLVLTQPADPLHPLCVPSNPGKKRPTQELRLGLISSAHLEVGWGQTGDHWGRGLDLLLLTHSRRRQTWLYLSVLQRRQHHRVQDIRLRRLIGPLETGPSLLCQQEALFP